MDKKSKYSPNGIKQYNFNEEFNLLISTYQNKIFLTIKLTNSLKFS